MKLLTRLLISYFFTLFFSQMDFAFETQGEQNDMAIGIMYDFSKGFSNGMLLMKVKAAPLNKG